VKDKKTFLDRLQDTSKPLLTVSNHRSNVDDPLFWHILSCKEFFRNVDRFRYTLTAHDICFTTSLHSYFFSLGRCIPCVRGAGIFQPSVDFCIDVLSKKGWVHMFPEGKVTQTPIRIKWGISRMIAESKTPPILLPIWFNGMRSVWPQSPPYYPGLGKVVEVVIGTPIDCEAILKNLKGETELARRKEIADVVQNALFDLGRVTATTS